MNIHFVTCVADIASLRMQIIESLSLTWTLVFVLVTMTVSSRNLYSTMSQLPNLSVNGTLDLCYQVMFTGTGKYF